MKVDYLIVGSGLTGSIIARILSDAKREVVIVEKRNHIGGNVYDFLHDSGIRIHKYGPHYFRTSSKRVWNFVNRFTRFYEYHPVVKVWDGKEYHNWPIHFANEKWNSTIGLEKNTNHFKPANFEETCLQKIPMDIYQRVIKGYTRKQWGVEPSSLSVSLAKRIKINMTNDFSLTPFHHYQGLPTEGYTKMISNIIGDIPLYIDFDYLKRRDEILVKQCLVFTGPIDAFFDFEYGKLNYRSNKRVVSYHDDVGEVQPYVQVNYSNESIDCLRSIEWKKMMPIDSFNESIGSVITYEYPFTPSNADDVEYPFPNRRNYELARQYRKKALLEGVHICGRLGDYKYYDMDIAINRAISKADTILKA